MYHAGLVGHVQGVGDLHAQFRRFLGRQPLGAEPFLEVRPFDKIADDVEGIPLAAHLVYGHDVRMPHLGRGPGLAEEHRRLIRIELPAARDLHRHPAIERGVVGLPYAAALSNAHLLDEREFPDGLAARCDMRNGGLYACQAEVAAARGTRDVDQRVVGHHGHRMVAVGAADVQSPVLLGRRRAHIASSGVAPMVFPVLLLSHRSLPSHKKNPRSFRPVWRSVVSESTGTPARRHWTMRNPDDSGTGCNAAQCARSRIRQNSG